MEDDYGLEEDIGYCERGSFDSQRDRAYFVGRIAEVFMKNTYLFLED